MTISLALTLLFPLASLSAEPGDVVVTEVEVHVVESRRAKTREGSLRRFMDIQSGDSFACEDALLAAVQRQEQDLKNERVFQSVAVVAQPVGERQYVVRVTVEDSLTLAPIPYGAYDSNIGLQVGAETTYGNALGSMSDWYMDAYLVLGRDHGGDLGFRGFKINPKLEAIKIGDLRYQLELAQEKKSEYNTDEAGDYTQHYTHHSTKLKAGSRWEFTDFWFYSFYPQATFRYAYAWEELHPVESVEDRFEIAWEHSLGPRKVDVVHTNMRRGYDLELRHALKILGTAPAEVDATAFRFSTEVELDGRAYYTLGRAFNFYHRADALTSHASIQKSLGSRLRGVADSSMSGTMGLFQQNSFGFSLFHWRGVLNLQVHPFYDYGWSTGGLSGSTGSFRHGVGADILLFLDFVSNLTIRTTVGFDAGRDLQDEIIILTSYSY